MQSLDLLHLLTARDRMFQLYVTEVVADEIDVKVTKTFFV